MDEELAAGPRGSGQIDAFSGQALLAAIDAAFEEIADRVDGNPFQFRTAPEAQRFRAPVVDDVVDHLDAGVLFHPRIAAFVMRQKIVV